MLTPYEELEYLAEYLPEEGESVLVTRQGGELHCESMTEGDLRDGIDDVELYGRLVQANERLNAQGSLPLWITALGLTAGSIALYRLSGMSWAEWYALPALGLFGLFGCFHWIRRRQHRLFENDVLPMLQREANQRRITFYAMLAGVRQHSEFRTLLDELIRFQPDGRGPRDE
jgi:hypothetical protein